MASSSLPFADQRHGQVVVRFPVTRVDLQGLLPVNDGLVEIALPGQRPPEVVVRLGVVRTDP